MVHWWANHGPYFSEQAGGGFKSTLNTLNTTSTLVELLEFFFILLKKKSLTAINLG